MTPLEWNTCTDPERLLRYLHQPTPYRLSSRDRQMFGVAFCRRVWERLDQLSQKVVEVAERYAEGQADLDACREVYQALRISPPENVIGAYAALGALMCPTDAFSSEFMSQSAADAAYRFVRVGCGLGGNAGRLCRVACRSFTSRVGCGWESRACSAM